MNSYNCRDHGGTFYIQSRRGRPPVRCTEDNPCKQDGEGTPKRPKVADTRISKLAKATGLREDQIVITSPVKPPTNKSVGLAQACKAELEALGWEAKGRGWFEEPDGGEFPGAMMAQVTATRGSESLVITWNDGKLASQDYNLWHNRRSLNGMPPNKLKFNPDEMTDRELVRAIAGMKVTWWNTLGKTEETFVVSGDRLSIEHFYASNGEEDTGRRIVKFLDQNGNGYRHFHTEALLKVG